MELDELFAFCDSYSRLYVYGDGKMQILVLDFLRKNGYTIEGMVVSDRYYSNQDGIYKISKIKDDDKPGIIVALSFKHFKDVIIEIVNAGLSLEDVFFVSGNLKSTILKIDEEKPEYGKPKSIQDYMKYYEYVKSLSVPGQLNVFCCQHLGDALALLSLKNELEREYGKQVHYLLFKKQECLAKLYGIEHYTLVDFSGFIDFSETKGFPEWMIGAYESEILDFMFPHIPQVDVPFIWGRLSWNYQALEPWENMAVCRGYMFGLDIKKMQPPKYILDISQDVENKVQSLGGFDKVVLFAPAALSRYGIAIEFWRELSQKLISEGYSVIVNAVHEKTIIEGCHYLDLSTSDLIALGQRVHAVYSSRSGLCDCLSNIGQKLHVYYRSDMDRGVEYWSINGSFDILEEVNETVIEVYE